MFFDILIYAGDIKWKNIKWLQVLSTFNYIYLS